MWLGVAAGLALLTLSFARLADAQNVTVNDQQLLYNGPGWRTFRGPPACAGISQSVHSTNNPGDTVSYSFTGNAISVHTSSTSGLVPMTVVLDGAVQPVSPVIQDGFGCGILYSNPNIPQVRQQHTLVIVYRDPSGASTLSVSGISTSTASAATVQNAAPPSLQVPPAGSVSPGSPSTNSPTGVFSPLVPNPTGGSNGPTAGIAPSPTSSDPEATAGVINTSALSSVGMTAGVIGAIVGAIVGMLALLVLFLLIRRRITRQAARKLDGQANYRRGFDMEEGKGKGRALPLDDGRTPAWSTNMPKDEFQPYTYGWDVQRPVMTEGQGQAGPLFTVVTPMQPAMAASGTDSQSLTPPVFAPRNYTPSGTRSPTTPESHNSAPFSYPQTAADMRPVPAALILHQNGSYSPPPPGLQTADSPVLSYRTTPPQFSAPVAPYAAGRSESAASVRSGPRGPGYI